MLLLEVQGGWIWPHNVWVSRHLAVCQLAVNLPVWSAERPSAENFTFWQWGLVDSVHFADASWKLHPYVQGVALMRYTLPDHISPLMEANVLIPFHTCWTLLICSLSWLCIMSFSKNLLGSRKLLTSIHLVCRSQNKTFWKVIRCWMP